MRFSEEWTDEERLKLIVVVAAQIQTDIPAGHYGAPVEEDERGNPTKFRPNMQTIIEIALAPADLLEADRASLEEMIDDFLRDSGQTAEEFYSRSLTEVRGNFDE